MGKLAVPSVFHSFAYDDPLIEGRVQEELTQALEAAQTSETSAVERLTVMQFGKGGHNIQKLHARQLGKALKQWMAAEADAPESSS